MSIAQTLTPPATQHFAGTLSAADKLKVDDLPLDVRNYGAAGDGVTDDTAAIRAAIAAVSSRGGVVYFPAGSYLTSGTISVPAGVMLQGPPGIPPNDTTKGAVILVTGGAGATTTPAFLLDERTAIRGLTMYWPNQVAATASTPTQYGWAIATDTTKGYRIIEVQLEELLLINPYLGVSLDLCEKVTVRKVYGQPLKTGIFIDRMTDVSRVEDVHFWSFYASGTSNLAGWIQANGTAFDIRHVDLQQAVNCFCYGYLVGWNFDAGSDGGTPWMELVNCSADNCSPAISISRANTLHFLGGTFTNKQTVGGGCLTTSSDILGSSGAGSVAFVGSQFYSSGIGANISSNTGDFEFTGAQFKPSAAVDGNGLRMASVAVSGTASVRLVGCAGVAGEMILGRDNVVVNGVPLPQATIDITPANFDLTTWASSAPTGWTLSNATTSDIAQVTGGIQLNLVPGTGGATVDKYIEFPVPADLAAAWDFYVLKFTLHQGTTGSQPDAYRVFVKEQQNNSTNITSQFRVTSGYVGPDLTVYVPMYFGPTSGTRVIRIEWQAFGSVAGSINLTGLKWYKCATSVMGDWQINYLAEGNFPYLFANPYSTGPVTFKQGSANKRVFGTVAPTAGSWSKGDFLVNNAPSSGSAYGWICVTAGTPGTWLAVAVADLLNVANTFSALNTFTGIKVNTKGSTGGKNDALGILDTESSNLAKYIRSQGGTLQILKNDFSGVSGTLADGGTYTFPDSANVVLGTTTGTKIGTSTTQKLGFWNQTPVVQQILATGAANNVDSVISLLQILGLCRQS